MIKKWFFDLWDNLFHAMLMSVAFALLMALLMMGSFGLGAMVPLLGYAAVALSIVLLFIYAGAVNRYTLGFVKSERFLFGDFPKYLKAGLIPAALMGILSLVAVFLFLTGIRFYGSLNSMIGIIAIALLFWALVFWVFAVQYWLPLNAQIEPNSRKLIKKSFLLFIDNPMFTLFMFIGAVIITVLSVLTASLFPGFTGLILWFQVGLKLRMYKYDYLETLGEEALQSKKKVVIPWDTLLAAERERIGSRTLRNMFFPWKE